jgi:hypothetical protein
MGTGTFQAWWDSRPCVSFGAETFIEVFEPGFPAAAVGTCPQDSSIWNACGIFSQQREIAMKAERTVVTMEVPDYSRVPFYRPTDEERATMGAGTVDELVALYNGEMARLRRPPLTCFDYPSSARKLAKLVKRIERLRSLRNAP